MRQAGRYLPEYRATRSKAGSFLDLCFNPDLAIEVTLQPIRRFGFDAAILFSDILVVPYALGQNLWFEEGQGPKLTPLDPARDLGELSLDSFHDRLGPVYETLSGLTRTLPKQTALIGFAGAPWTVASYMIEGGSSRDFATAKLWAYQKPDLFARLIDLLVEATSQYLLRQIKQGAEVLQLFDSWAGAWPAAQILEWCFEPVLKIIARVKAEHPKVPIILFPKGIGPSYEVFADCHEVEALSLDSSLPLDWVGRHLKGKAVLQGNLDPLVLVSGGSALEKATTDLLEGMEGSPFIFNLGHGIVPQTPPSHVENLLRFVRG